MGEGSAASNALVQSTLLGELLEHAHVGALAADSGRYIAANEYACEVTGYERSELIGRPVDDLCRQRGSGVIALGCKDGGEIEVSYRVVEAELAGIAVTLGLFWPA
ncbi:MAG TPA: PAS domain-containing protein [Gaiellaceae bacterium]|nr:PAS domain-containing protein [Gaiellaceae bacterium]